MKEKEKQPSARVIKIRETLETAHASAKGNTVADWQASEAAVVSALRQVDALGASLEYTPELAAFIIEKTTIIRKAFDASVARAERAREGSAS